MAYSLISSSHHVDFDSVFGMDDAALVQMFESLIATRLKEFLGCPAVFYEAALTEFFTNGSVRQDGMVVSTIRGTTVEISESMFAAVFELPTEGLTDLSDVPKNLVFDARSLFSESKEQVSISCLKKELKIQYRLLHDILAKTIYVKAGSFDDVTRDRFMLMTAITCDVKVNWSNLLFIVFKDMVTPGTRQEKGSAILISCTGVAINEKVGVEDVTDEPRVRKTHVKKAVSQKRPAVGVEADLVVKKKRTTKVVSYSGSSRRLQRVATSRQIIQSRATVDPVTSCSGPSRELQCFAYPVAGNPDSRKAEVAKSCNQAQSTSRKETSRSSSRYEPAAKQLTNYEELPKLDVVSRRFTQLQVMCSGGTVDNQLREACCVGNIPVADMVTPGTRQAKGFAIQISVLLKNVPRLDLGESRAFPILRVLTEKTVHRFVAINEKVGVEDVTDEPRVRKTHVKKAVSQKRPAVAIANAPVEQPPVLKRKSQKRKRRLVLSADDGTVDEQPAAEVESTVVKQPAVAVALETGVLEPVDENVERVYEPVPESVEQPAVTPVVEAATDDPDAIIEQVLDQLDSVAANQDSEISLTLPLPPALSPVEIELPVKIWHHTFTAHMANQIKRRNVSSLTYENFPGGHPSSSVLTLHA
ncbi:hypothetical protein F511_28969 [Dorcoceras hygrometricum]|uniref:Dystroglycan-like n=1 Tax=Dorcoceras hygrometricum TaxID=472368 RepID=A0A2Z7A8W2_9LAMI|nr:hypothetical protein F511_28969 [Dorcoceras hygrometricum]